MMQKSREKDTKYIPNFRDGYPFSKELFAVKMGKTNIKMRKPEHLGEGERKQDANV